jgi:hypothetical protein
MKNLYMVKVMLSLCSFTPWPLYPWGKSPQYPFNMRQGGPQPQSAHLGEENNLLSLLKMEPEVLSFLAHTPRHLFGVYQLIYIYHSKENYFKLTATWPLIF